ncbi:MAG: ABC transporter permease subunit [Candidatus Dormiibacterota bacterium]
MSLLSRADAPRARPIPGGPMGRFFGRDWKFAAVFVGPAILVLLVLIAYPFFYSIWLSFTERHIGNVLVFVGIKNYTSLWQDSFFRDSLKNSVVFTVYSESFKVTIGLIAALLLHHLKRGRSILTGLVLLPWIIPTVVTALGWRLLVDPLFGGLDAILTFTHVGPLLYSLHFLPQWPETWLGDPGMAMGVVVAVNIWKGIPFFTINFLAALKAISSDQYEAAAVDGASVWHRFRHVTLPGIRPVLIITTLLSTLWTFNTFDIIWLMTQGGPGDATLPYVVFAYEKGVQQLEYGPGAAVALTALPVTAILVFALARYLRRSDQDVGAPMWGAGISRLARPVGIVAGLLLLVALFMLDRDLLWKAAVVMAVIVVIAYLYGRWVHEPLATFAKRGGWQRLALSRVPQWLAFVVLLAFTLGPMYWMVVTAFKSDLQQQIRTSLMWPSPWTLSQFTALFQQNPFLTWYRNTIIVAGAATLLGVALSALLGYGLARLKFRGQQTLTGGVLLTYIMPGALLFIPLYQILSGLHLINSLWSLIVAYPTFTIPFASWLLMGYFRNIPAELEESAFVDGASRLQAFWRITLPLAKPALLAVALFTLTNAWNEFLFAYVFITNNSLMTLPVGMQSMIVGDILPWGQLMAASVLVTVPVVVIYSYAQRFLVEGLTVGAVKG